MTLRALIESGCRRLNLNKVVIKRIRKKEQQFEFLIEYKKLAPFLGHVVENLNLEETPVGGRCELPSHVQVATRID